MKAQHPNTRLHAISRKVSLGTLGLGVLVGCAPPLLGQAASDRRGASAVTCTVVTEDRIARHSSVTAALQHEVLGLRLMTSSGQVGYGSTLRVRGNNTISGTADPVVYIDGVRMTERTPPGSSSGSGAVQVLDLVNPEDVYRIEVLSGPAATALYGTQASGGMILLYTKHGGLEHGLVSPWFACS